MKEYTLRVLQVEWDGPFDYQCRLAYACYSLKHYANDATGGASF